MKTLYRISNSSNKKEKLSFATKEKCLNNFFKHFSEEETIIFADNVTDETWYWLETFPLEDLRRTYDSGDAGSFRNLLHYASSFDDDEIIYFVEDDYIHRKDSKRIIEEGLDFVDYVSLYDHPDKYMPPDIGGNPLINEDGTEDTKIFLTNSSHWKLANSTTFCFASRVKTLREDYDIFIEHTTGHNCVDFPAFRKLINKGRKLATPIPGRSTHAEIKWLSPLIDWEKEI